MDTATPHNAADSLASMSMLSVSAAFRAIVIICPPIVVSAFADLHYSFSTSQGQSRRFRRRSNHSANLPTSSSVKTRRLPTRFAASGAVVRSAAWSESRVTPNRRARLSNTYA